MDREINKTTEEIMDDLEPLFKLLYESGSMDVFNLKIAIEKALHSQKQSLVGELEELTSNGDFYLFPKDLKEAYAIDEQGIKYKGMAVNLKGIISALHDISSDKIE